MELSAAKTLGGFFRELDVLNSSDACWLIPLHRRKRRYFVIKWDKKYCVYLRTAQGNRGAPLTWSRFGALISRLTQGVFGLDVARLELYVEDTFLAFFGLRTANRANLAIVIYSWAALGLPLALHKAGHSTRVA